jgi:hypothetical protein
MDKDESLRQTRWQWKLCSFRCVIERLRTRHPGIESGSRKRSRLAALSAAT